MYYKRGAFQKYLSADVWKTGTPIPHPNTGECYLYLGDIEISHDYDWLEANRIGFVINISELFKNPDVIETYEDMGIDHFHYYLYDSPGEDIISAAFILNQKINEWLDENPHRCVLVHCAAGISRSASVVIFHLMTECGMTYNEAHGYVLMLRPRIKPNTGFELKLRGLGV